MIEQLHVDARTQHGKQHTKRLRASGSIPAILYGHGQENLSLSIASSAVSAVIRHGVRVVQLAGVVSDSAIVKDIQWDAIGANVLHVDLARVDRDEKVRIEIRLELKGDAPGSHRGGVVELVMHELEIECPVTDLPEKLIVNVSALDVGQAINASAIGLPPNAKLLTDPDAMVVHCIVPLDEDAVATGPAEPELIAKKAAADEESAE
jgi:large subunit ribosomal protein L25